MLFDLRSRRRRRFIQVVYGFLALLIGGGLVLFGVGGGSGATGVLSGLEQNGTGSASGIKLDYTAMLNAQRIAKREPSNAAAWDRYALKAFTLAQTNYVSSTTSAGFTPAGAKELQVVKRAWNHYLSLTPANPDPALAADVSFAFGLQPGIQLWKTAEGAAEIVATANPKSFADYETLALDAYLAKDKTTGHLAEAHAIAVAPKSDRSSITSYLAQVGGPTGSSGATGSSAASGASGSTATTGNTGASG
jgi:hypothetical protein